MLGFLGGDSDNFWDSVVVVVHRRRIYTEELAKFVASVCGTEFIQFLAAPAILHQDDLKNRMNSSFFHSILVQFIHFFISLRCKIARAERILINSVPQTAATTFAFSFV